MAEILAVIQGKEAASSINRLEYVKNYEAALELYKQGYTAIKTNNGYVIEYHPAKWNRRVR